MMNEPNPHAQRINEIIAHSHSLGAEPGDLVRLNKESIVALYRERKSGEPYERMIQGYTTLSSPYAEFVILSCGHAFSDCIAEIIVKGYRLPHPCYTFPCQAKST